MLIMCKNEKKKQNVPVLSLHEEKKMFDLTQKLQRNNIFCFN
jgi:hypothetical protein